MREAWILAPWTVRVAVLLGLLTIAVAAVARLFGQYSQDGTETLISWSIGAAIALWFTSRLLRGRNWARIVLTVIAALGVVVVVVDVVSGSFGLTPVSYAQTVPNLIATVLLWLPPSWPHFAKKDA